MNLRRSEPAPFSVPRGSGDLIGELQRKNRRRVLKRAAQLTALGMGLLLAGLGIKHFADVRDRDRVVQQVRDQYVRGTVADVVGAVELADLGLDRHPEHAPLRHAEALMRAHLWAEFGSGEREALAAVDALEPSDAKTIADGIVAFSRGDIARAAEAAAASLGEDASDFARLEADWLRGMVAAANAESDPEGLRTTLASLEKRVDAGEAGTAIERVHATLLLLAGDSEAALARLADARASARSHYGLAADEALFNAHLHQELGGVASVADQLLEMPPAALSPRDRAHAALSRAVAHVGEGEGREAIERIDEAWPGLAPWNMLARRLAVQTALDAGDTSRLEEQLAESAFAPDEASIFRAWAVLLSGDVMAALERLEASPQAHPWVGLLQALALVEQGRWEEAKPWIERAQKLLPGRHDAEVAAARVDLRLGDEVLALRRLEALAQQEAHAPRALTGLGEAHLLQKGDAKSDKDAKRALEKALEREPVPAEAQFLLSRIWHRRRATDPYAEQKALELLRASAKTNPHLPKYRVALANYLADLGAVDEALSILRDLQGEVGVPTSSTLRHVRLLIERDGPLDERTIERLLDEAEQAGADSWALDKERARLDLRRETKESLSSARTGLENLLASRPTDTDAHVLLAMVLLKQFDRKGADAVARRAVASVPPGNLGPLRLARARISARVGRTAQAAPMARSAWNAMLGESSRTTAELLDAAALTTRLWTRRKRDAAALRVARELTGRVAYHADAWTIRARTELAANEASSARASAEKAIELDPNSAAAHEIHGHCLLRFGDKDGARNAYNRAIELAGEAEAEYRKNLDRL